MSNAASSSNVEGRVSFTGFTLMNETGEPITGTVAFTPEPPLSMLVGGILLLYAIFSNVRRTGPR